MTLLDDARRLAAPGINLHCDFCTGSPIGGHFAGCPILAAPRIVAALEAAEQLTAPPIDAEPTDYARGDDVHYWAFCERRMDQGHEPDCPWQALVAALRGEGVMA